MPRFVAIADANLTREFCQRVLVKYPTLFEVAVGADRERTLTWSRMTMQASRDEIYASIVEAALGAAPAFGEPMLKNTLHHLRYTGTRNVSLSVRRCILPVLDKQPMWKDFDIYAEALLFVEALAWDVFIDIDDGLVADLL